MGRSGLASHLIKEGKLSERHYQIISRSSEAGGASVAKAVIALGIFSEQELCNYLVSKTGFQMLPNEAPCFVGPETRGMYPEDLIKDLEVVPLKYESPYLSVAMLDPLDRETLEQLHFFTDCKIKPIVASLSSLHRGLSLFDSSFAPQQTRFEEILSKHRPQSLEAKSEAAVSSDMPSASSSLQANIIDSNYDDFEDLRSLDLDAEYAEEDEVIDGANKASQTHASPPPPPLSSPPPAPLAKEPPSNLGEFELDAASQGSLESLDLDDLGSAEELPELDFDPSFDDTIPPLEEGGGEEASPPPPPSGSDSAGGDLSGGAIAMWDDDDVGTPELSASEKGGVESDLGGGEALMWGEEEEKEEEAGGDLSGGEALMWGEEEEKQEEVPAAPPPQAEATADLGGGETMMWDEEEASSESVPQEEAAVEPLEDVEKPGVSAEAEPELGLGGGETMMWDEEEAPAAVSGELGEDAEKPGASAEGKVEPELGLGGGETMMWDEEEAPVGDATGEEEEKLESSTEVKAEPELGLGGGETMMWDEEESPMAEEEASPKAEPDLGLEDQVSEESELAEPQESAPAESVIPSEPHLGLRGGETTIWNEGDESADPVVLEEKKQDDEEHGLHGGDAELWGETSDEQPDNSENLRLLNQTLSNVSLSLDPFSSGAQAEENLIKSGFTRGITFVLDETYTLLSSWTESGDEADAEVAGDYLNDLPVDDNWQEISTLPVELQSLSIEDHKVMYLHMENKKYLCFCSMLKSITIDPKLLQIAGKVLLQLAKIR